MEIFEGIGVNKSNPSIFYKIKGKITPTIYKAQRKSDSKEFAMKNVAVVNFNQTELLKMKNELVVLA